MASAKGLRQERVCWGLRLVQMEDVEWPGSCGPPSGLCFSLGSDGKAAGS